MPILDNTVKSQSQALRLTLQLPKSDCYFSPLDAIYFPVNKLQEFSVISS